MTEKAKPVVAEAISKMKNAMFNQLTGSEAGLHDTCTFTIPVIDLMILEREAIQLENDYERLREAIEKIAYSTEFEELYQAEAFATRVLEGVNEWCL